MSERINWFPGHMAKAMRTIKEDLNVADVIIYVLDSRAPKSCLNPVFDELFVSKKIIYVLNKSDLGATSLVKSWVTYLTTDNSVALSTLGTASDSAKPIIKYAAQLCQEKLNKYKAKGVKKTLRAMVTGVPNTGKSTIINNLCGFARTAVKNKPGVTRGKQWVRINDYFEVLDTPGTLYPKIENEAIARRLAYIGSIRDEVFDTYDLACSLVFELNDYDPQLLFDRYKTQFLQDSAAFIKAAAQKRGYILKGGEVDEERMATAIIDDFRKGRLGKITLEKAEK